MTTKKQPVVKNDLPVNKSDPKEVAKKSDKTPLKKEPERLKAVVKENNIVQLEISRDDAPTLNKTTGFDNSDASFALLETGMMTVSSMEEATEAIAVESNKYLAMMADLNPHDGFEGLLISQMVVTFEQAMNYIRIANLKHNRESSSIQDSIMNRAVKLMRLYNQQLEALDRHRRKGNQKMTVEHVHVHEGGQAIVGTVNQGGGANNEN